MGSLTALQEFLRPLSRSLLAVFCCLAAANACATPARAQESDPSLAAMLSMLKRRVLEEPMHADSWRLIAKIHHRTGKSADAIAALQKALASDPESVAAHFDFGEVLESTGDQEAAERHYAAVIGLAPQSSYASQLAERGIVTDAEAGTAAIEAAKGMRQVSAAQPVMPVAYQIQTFDGSQPFERQWEALESDATLPVDRWRALVETGLLYNTNVSLTPISRELANAEAAAFQGFLNPEWEFLLVQHDSLRTGPLTRGYFSLNERHQSEFDLAAFQAGWFGERDFGLEGRDLVGRLDYIYSLDRPGGSRFGDRHSLTASATSIDDGGDVTYLYGTLSVSDFKFDGPDPPRDSLDGPAFFTGITRFFQTERDHWRSFRLGADVSLANTEGDDFRYLGAGLHGGFTVAMARRLSVEPEMGLGFRVYDRFRGEVDRDEIVLRLAMKVKRQMSDRFTLAVVVGYDRFACDNEDFDAERTEGGIVSSWLR